MTRYQGTLVKGDWESSMVDLVKGVKAMCQATDQRRNSYLQSMAPDAPPSRTNSMSDIMHGGNMKETTDLQHTNSLVASVPAVVFGRRGKKISPMDQHTSGESKTNMPEGNGRGGPKKVHLDPVL